MFKHLTVTVAESNL